MVPLPNLLAFLAAAFVIVVVPGPGVLFAVGWALIAGTARTWFARSPRRLEAVGATGGAMIIGLGASVALTGAVK